MKPWTSEELQILGDTLAAGGKLQDLYRLFPERGHRSIIGRAHRWRKGKKAPTKVSPAPDLARVALLVRQGVTRAQISQAMGYSPTTVRRAIETLRDTGGLPPYPAKALNPPVVAQLARQGLSGAEIARRTGYSARQVQREIAGLRDEGAL